MEGQNQPEKGDFLHNLKRILSVRKERTVSPEESKEQFLESVTTERKPLSEEERKEAMEVASEIREKAVKKAKFRNGKNVVSFRFEDRKTSTIIVIDNRTKRVPHEKESLPVEYSEFSIAVRRYLKDEKGEQSGSLDAWHDYFFFPEKVTKFVTHPFTMKGDKLLQFETWEELESAWRRQDPKVISYIDYFNKQKEQQMQTEVYHPDKADLQNLLEMVNEGKKRFYVEP